MSRSWPKYAVFVLFLIFGLFVVHLSNIALLRDGDPAVTAKYLFVQYGVLFALGASLHLLTASELRFRLAATWPTLVLAIVLIGGSYITAVYNAQLHTEAVGYFEFLSRIALDDHNHLIINVLAGYLFGLSFIGRK
ncbi:hypothetical protein [Paenibacillus sp. NPDC058071]|uniref:hypothetical protein n=1 Tax=Paenibacillus sp. NPDC058071 TaxID=3346326 RepID=UPI0036DCD6B4